MGLVANEKYEQRKIDRLADYLRLYHEKGKPVDFEIIVDGFKVVRRTSDLEMFTMYENYVDADSKSVEFILYSGSSNNNDKHIFHFGGVPKNTLDGIDVQEQIKSGVSQQLRELHYVQLEEKNRSLEKEVKELEDELEELEKKNAALEESKSPLNGFLGDVGASMFENLIRRNPKLMASIPGGETLAGLLASGDAGGEEPNGENSEVSYKSKSQQPSQAESKPITEALSEEDQNAITFVSQLKAQFNRQEFDKIVSILQELAKDKTRFDLVLNQLNLNSK